MTAREVRLLRLVRALRAGGGNPYHDPATGEFTSGPGGGHGKHRARRRRRRERLRERLKAQAKELKEGHAHERKERRKSERRDRRELRARYRKEWRDTIKAARGDIAKASTARERNEIRARAREDLANLKADYAQAKADLRETHLQQHKTDAQYHKEEWDSFRDDMKGAIADAGFERKTRGRSDIRGIRRGDEAGAVPPAVSRELAMSPGRTHKASSAEAILRHCLRSLGLTRRWREGRLTRRQARMLLDQVRQYARAWLRHEAEAFLAPHVPTGRGIRWEEAPGGFLHAVDTGFVAGARRFFARAKQFVRESILAATMSLLGPAPLTGEELDAAEREAVRQEQWFDRFRDEALTPGPAMTPAQFVARAEKYGDSAWQAAQRVNHDTATKRGVAIMARRVLGHPKTEHCSDCPPLAAKGWQPIGTLPRIGDTECGPLCLCHFEFLDKDGNRFLQGKAGPAAAPDTIDVEPDDGGVYPVAEPPGGLKVPVPIAGPPR